MRYFILKLAYNNEQSNWHFFDFAFFGGSKWFCLFVNKNAENEY